jgi:hypothetical protein
MFLPEQIIVHLRALRQHFFGPMVFYLFLATAAPEFCMETAM